MTEARRRSPAPAAGLLTFVTLELLRTFLPAALLVRPEDTGTPMLGAAGLGAGVLVLAPVLGAWLVADDPRRTWITAGAVAVLARGTLLAGLGPSGQLVVAGVGTAAGLVALTALAAATTADRAARVGVLLGLAAHALLLTGTGGEGLRWSGTAGATLVTLALLVALLRAVARTGEHLERPAGTRTPPAWPWWWLLPALTLGPILTTNPGRLAIASGWAPPRVAAAMAGFQVTALLAAMIAPRLAPARTGIAGGAATLVGAAAALTASGWAGLLGPLTAAVGLGTLAGTATAPVAGTTVTARARVAGGALAVSGLVTLAYYLATPLGLPGNPRWLLLAMGAVAGLLGARYLRRTAQLPLRARIGPRALVRGLLLAVMVTVVVALSAQLRLDPITATGPGGELTVAAFPLRAGFGTDGRYDTRRQAQLLAAEGVDVVVVTGVDRGSWLAGGQDQLPALAAELGLAHQRFAPTEDEVRGHALLSRFPIVEFGVNTLPGGTERSRHAQLAAVLELDDGTPLGVVGTALATGHRADELRLPQARAVAGTVARLRERSIPTVVLGDLGADTGSVVLESFEGLVGTAIPEGSRTYPSAAPTELRATVLLSPDLRRSTITIPFTQSSSHLPVIVTVERTPAAE